MRMNCPHGWKSSAKLGNITIENRTVNVCADICDSADLCGVTTCEYYDVTREGTRRFQQANAHERTMEGMLEIQTRKRENVN